MAKRRPRIRREIPAFLIVAFSAFCIVSMLSYQNADYAVAGGTAPARNAFGWVGAKLSRFVFDWVGVAGGFVLAAIIGLGGLSAFFHWKVVDRGWKIFGAAMFILALATLEGLVSPGGPAYYDGPLKGGYLGAYFHRHLTSYVNPFGAHIIVGLSIVTAILVSSDRLLFPRWRGAGDLVRVPWHRLREVVGRLPLLRRRGTGRGKGKPARALRVRSEVPSPGGAPPGGAGGADGDSRGDPAQGEVRERKIRIGVEPAQDPKADPPFEVKERRRPAARYRLPSLDLLDPTPKEGEGADRLLLHETAERIEETLKNFKIQAEVVEVQKGPTVTQYELALAAGIKVHKIMSLADDLAIALKAPTIRVVAPIPGKSTVGVEVPNKQREIVRLRELLESDEYQQHDHDIPLLLGKDTSGNVMVSDLTSMPHLLIAGTTGAGKSVCINSVILDILMTRTPDEVRLILIDPKMVELAPFEGIPHLLTPVVSDMKRAPAVLEWLTKKMDERYEILHMAGVRHINTYNALDEKTIRERLSSCLPPEDAEKIPGRMPYIVVIIDELADLMMTAPKETETNITRLAQKSRSVGIHVIVATQRPSVDVITGLIKTNMPTRISFHVASKVDSRTILDRNGAEKLLGRGDMLFIPPGTSALKRCQGTYISDREVKEVVRFVKEEASPAFTEELEMEAAGGDPASEDELYEKALQIILNTQRGSASLLQRQLGIGYTRASRLMDLMHDQGIVGPYRGSKPREVYYTLEEWEAKTRSEVTAEG